MEIFRYITYRESAMNITIIYFSQTGNTRKVARAMADVFEASGNTPRLISFKKATHDDLTDTDLIGIGAPCFESQAPTPVRKFLKNLSSLSGKKGFVFSTSGGGPGRVLYDLSKPLMDKGVDVIGGFLCRGTCYYIVPCLVGRFPDRPNEKDLSRAGDFVRSLIHHLSSAISGPMPESRPDTFKHGLGFYNIMGALINDSMMRRIMPAPKANEKICTECGWCVHECPTNSMKITPKPNITKTCIRCYRCIAGCPEQALSVKWGASNFAVWSIYNQTFERWLGDVQPGERCY